ncbi:hypothetical protein CYY_009622 [Polysphondylium violaceum]|uniref:Dickkopf N-terminal cysteine-rich domain-containing protein n=1 Tax=Polysphondylium violaceum TaxID=133409 RepID=A0A8J4UVS0_9MYCE|nr:hypothetical protein CYY_009622 [Polysphondylium violaceum]
MIKLFYLLFIFSISIHLIYADGCFKFQVLNQFEICDTPGQVCGPGLFCHQSDTPVCLPLNPAGESCWNDNECAKGLKCYRYDADSFCADVYYKGYGEKCINKAECSRGLGCINGTCYASEEANCFRGSCPGSQYCNSTSTCNNFIEDGSRCITDDNCFPGSICVTDPKSGMSFCTKMNTVAEGLPCNRQDLCDISQNLVCLNGYCVVYNDDKSNAACNVSTACPLDKERCICNNIESTAGECTQTNMIGASCKTAKVEYYNCLKSSGCPIFVDNPDSANACVSKQCGKLKCTYESECIDPTSPDAQSSNICVNSGSKIIAMNSLIILLILLVLL